MKKHYYIREGSPLAKILDALPIVGIIAMVIAAGIMNSWELGLL